MRTVRIFPTSCRYSPYWPPTEMLRQEFITLRDLKLKESNRLESAAAMINSLGGHADITDDGIIITPTGKLKGGTVDSFGDHRIVMSAAIAALGCEGNVIIKGAQAAEKSYPDFFKDYTKAGGDADVISME